MKSYAHLASRLFGCPLLLRTPVIHHFGAELAARMAGVVRESSASPSEAKSEPPRISAAFADPGGRRVKSICEQRGDVAIIHVSGVIDKAISDADMDCYGGLDLRDVDAAISLAEADPIISRVVFAFDTPGGSTTGVAETAQRIARLAMTKEVHAYTDSMCCSAGMWLASQADHIVATPSAIVGSIGVYIALLDESEALAMDGYKVELIKAGQFKAMGASFKPLSDDERALLRATVDQTYDAFRTAITAKRDVPQEAMEGQWYDGHQADLYNVIDATTTASLDEYVADLLLR
jgi:protease-4